jgi:hypothetical protein
MIASLLRMKGTKSRVYPFLIADTTQSLCYIRFLPLRLPSNWRLFLFHHSLSRRLQRIRLWVPCELLIFAAIPLYSCGNKTFSELTNFPNLETDSPEVGREKQRRLLGLPVSSTGPKMHRGERMPPTGWLPITM